MVHISQYNTPLKKDKQGASKYMESLIKTTEAIYLPVNRNTLLRNKQASPRGYKLQQELERR